MAERIVSPGVFTNEKDLSFLPTGISEIGAAIIGPTLKGPAFVPTVIRNFNDFIVKFGGLSETTYVPYAVKSYLQAAGTVTVVRVLQEGGYAGNIIQIVVSSSFGEKLVSTLRPTTTVGQASGSSYTNSDFSSMIGQSVTGSFGVVISGSSAPSASRVTASLQPSKPAFISKVVGAGVVNSNPVYATSTFTNFLTTVSALSGSIVSTVLTSSAAFANYSQSTAGLYQAARTSYITSQILGGQQLSLFKFHTLADGTDTNKFVKISIINNSLPGTVQGTDYGLFTVLVRDFADTDQQPLVLETYNNLTLDPDSPNYISRRIGDRYYRVSDAGVLTLLGDYDNVSKYVRVEVVDDVKNKAISPSVKPFGFETFIQPISSSYRIPTASYVIQDTIINGAYNKKAYYGWNFGETDNDIYLEPLTYNSFQNGTNFNLDTSFVHPSASAASANSVFVGGASISGSTFSGVDVSNILKFTVPFQGGFDGMDPAIPKNVGANILPENLFGMNCSNASKAGAKAYIKALNVIADAESFDLNLIAVPGATIADHSAIVTKAIEVAEDRGDCFVIADPVVQGSSVAAAISALDINPIDSNYVGVYWPWIKILDTDRNKPVWVPPSVVVPRVFAYNDSVAFEWFAPAGLNRGGIAEAIDAEIRLTQADRDDLYEKRINPIATFPAQGICIWGQKTLQVKPSALDRINVRRLLITLKKFIASASRYLVFENNTAETRLRFVNIVTPYLDGVKSRQGLYAFRVVMDETNNTPDVIDRNIMYGQIYLQPAKTAEFIILDFNILPTGATFTNA
jgi:phage tail sheath protein FI